jgi:hypothetical protein
MGIDVPDQALHGRTIGATVCVCQTVAKLSGRDNRI